jgi:glycosyltransferase involved in cell wall biosynthesis
VLRRADAVVYVSEMLHREGVNVAGPHRSCVIPYGTDEHPDLEAHPDAVFTVVTAARLIERKKIADLIEAFAVFSSRAPEARLVIIGDGPERDRLARLIHDRGLTPSVELTGALSHRETVARIARCHVFVLPSVREALGTVYFEAMSVGVPVVGLRGEGIAWHVSDGQDGFLVEPGDVRGLAAILERLHGDDRFRREIAANGVALFRRSGVRWPDYVAAHVDLFERVLA